MTERIFVKCFIWIVVLMTTPNFLIAQTQGSEEWTQTQTAWGDPDIQGIWNNVTATRLERPEDLSERNILTDEEAAEYSQSIADIRAEALARPHIGYNVNIWFESSDLLSGNRTSLLIDPPDGKLPPLTSLAKKVAEAEAEARRMSPADTWWDRGPYERCISRGLPGAMLPGFYNHNYQILQTPNYVVILLR